MSFKEIKTFYKQRKQCASLPNVRFYNFWDSADYSNIWLYQFLEKQGLLNNQKKKIAFFSVFGSRKFVKWDRSDVKIFYTGENVTPDGLHPTYHDHLLDSVSLSLGFEYLPNTNYLRFPLWILYYIKPNATLQDITDTFRKLSDIPSKSSLDQRTFCALVARHDKGNVRQKIYELLNGVGQIDCGGAFQNNTDRLIREFNDNKIDFLKQYKFNICPENTDTDGYVTEKIFESINGGCIPIYWGAHNCPEPEVLNQDAILFWNKDSAIQQKLLSDVTLLFNSPNDYMDFISQPKFMPYAAEYTETLLSDLRNSIHELLKNH